MKILLTGGAGYVGSACLRWLLRNGHDPIAYDNLLEGNIAAVPDAPRRLIVGDIAETDRLARVLAEHRIEAVMHFAALASVPDSIADPEAYYQVNVIGTKSVLDAMRMAGVRKILFSSTAATYGFQSEMPLREESPQLPETPYGTTKLAAEWLIKDYARAYGLGYALLRYFNACGADSDGRHGEDRRHESHLIPLIFQVAVGRREKLLIYGAITRPGTGPACATISTPMIWPKPTSSPSRIWSRAWAGPITWARARASPCSRCSVPAKKSSANRSHTKSLVAVPGIRGS